MTGRCTRCGAELTLTKDFDRLCWPYWRAEHDRTTRDAAYHTGYLEGLEVATNTLGGSVLRDAIAPCHTDRHPPERGMANGVTSALSEQLSVEGGENAALSELARVVLLAVLAGNPVAVERREVVTP